MPGCWEEFCTTVVVREEVHSLKAERKSDGKIINKDTGKEKQE
jgi:hypothetical protein